MKRTRRLLRWAPGWAAERLGPLLGRALDRCRLPPAGLLAGPQPGGVSAAGLPAVLVLLNGEPSGEALTGAVTALVSAVASGCGSRPVVVLDSPHLHQVRRAGMVVEYLMPPRTLAERFPDLRYDTYLAEHLTILTRDYATRHLLTLTADDLPEAGALSRLLRPPVAARPLGLVRRAATRAELLLDRSGSAR